MGHVRGGTQSRKRRGTPTAREAALGARRRCGREACRAMCARPEALALRRRAASLLNCLQHGKGSLSDQRRRARLGAAAAPPPRPQLCLGRARRWGAPRHSPPAPATPPRAYPTATRPHHFQTPQQAGCGCFVRFLHRRRARGRARSRALRPRRRLIAICIEMKFKPIWRCEGGCQSGGHYVQEESI